MKTMWLFLTNRCNLTCSYCYVRQNNQDMELKTALKAVAYFLASNHSHQEQKIIFFGGEPLLRSDLIAPIVTRAGQMAEKYKKKVVFWIYTNGTTLTKAIVKKLFSLGVRVSISFDGKTECHQRERLFKNGRSSLEKTLKNVPILLEYLPDTMVNASITPNNVRYLAGNIVFFKQLGFKRIYFQVITSLNWTDEDIAFYLEELRKSFDFYYKTVVSGQDYFYLSIFEDYLNNLGKHRPIAKKGCPAGLQNIAVSADGGIFPCHRFATLEHDGNFKELKHEYLLGDIFSGLTNRKLLEFLMNVEYNEVDGCSNCAVRNTCVNFCHWRDYITIGRFGERSINSCKLQREVNKEVRRLLEMYLGTVNIKRGADKWPARL